VLYEPGSHCVHDAALALLKDPAEQLLQTELAGPANCPGLQAMGSLVPAEQADPDGQAVHVWVTVSA